MNDRLVITIGALCWELGIEYAVDGVARACAAGASLRYDIVGAGPERDRALYTAFDLGIDDRVRVLEPTRDSVRSLLEADVFLWTGLDDHPSMAAGEASRLGLRVISTSIDGDASVPRRDAVSTATALVAASRNARNRDERNVSAEVIASILDDAGCA